MGQNVSIHSENHIFSDTSRLIKNQGTIMKGIVVEDDCWIGARTVILDGTHICRGSVMAAGAG